MRILVQDSVKKIYFDGVDWIGNAARAKTFENVAQAETYCREHSLLTALIVVQSNDGHHDVSYPVGVNNALLVSKPPTARIRSLC